MMSFEMQQLPLSNNKRTDAEYASKVLTKFLDFYEKEELCDTVLTAEIDNAIFKAHQIVLSAASEYFRALFSNSLTGDFTADVTVQEVEGDILKSVLNFIYTGSIELCSETVESVIKTAHYFQIDSLITVCCDFMAENIDVSNCLSVGQFADQYNLTALAEKSGTFACRNYEKVSSTKDFLELSEEYLCSFIARDDISVGSQEIVFHSIVAWINHDKENRNNAILNLLKYIRFMSLTQQFIIENVTEVCNTVECYKMVMEWLQWHKSTEKRLLIHTEQTKKLILLSFECIEGEISLKTFDPDSNTWTNNILAPLPHRSPKYFCSIRNNELILKGTRTKTGLCLDLKTNQWSEIPEMSPKYGFLLNGNTYYFKGNLLDSLHKYDNNSGSWQAMASFSPTMQSDIVSSKSVIDKLLYVRGILWMRSYDPILDQWTALKVPNRKLFIVEFNKHLYAFGGDNLVLRYHPLDDFWENSSYFEFGHIKSTISLNNNIIIYSEKNRQGIITQYNPETKSSQQLYVEPILVGVRKVLLAS